MCAKLLKALFVNLIIITVSGVVAAQSLEVCVVNGAYSVYGESPRASNQVVFATLVESLQKAGFHVKLDSSEDCVNADAPGNDCLPYACGDEALYLKVQERISGFSLSLISLHRGKVIEMSGPSEKELLEKVKEVSNTLMARPRGYREEEVVFDEGEENQPPVSKSTNVAQLSTSAPIPVTRYTYGDNHPREVMLFSISAGLTTGLGILSTVTNVVSMKIGDEQGALEPEDREHSELDKGRAMKATSIASGIGALAFTVPTVIFGIRAFAKEDLESSSVSIGPVFTGDFRGVMLKGEF